MLQGIRAFSTMRVLPVMAMTMTLIALSRLQASPQTTAQAAPPSSQTAAAAPAGDAENGRTIFVTRGCYQCHNYEGQGGSAGARLAPNPLPYRGFQAYVRAPRGEMPPYPAKILSDQDLADIYAFLRSRPRPPALATIPLLSR